MTNDVAMDMPPPPPQAPQQQANAAPSMKRVAAPVVASSIVAPPPPPKPYAPPMPLMPVRIIFTADLNLFAFARSTRFARTFVNGFTYRLKPALRRSIQTLFQSSKKNN